MVGDQRRPLYTEGNECQNRFKDQQLISADTSFVSFFGTAMEESYFALTGVFFYCYSHALQHYKGIKPIVKV